MAKPAEDRVAGEFDLAGRLKKHIENLKSLADKERSDSQTDLRKMGRAALPDLIVAIKTDPGDFFMREKYEESLIETVADIVEGIATSKDVKQKALVRQALQVVETKLEGFGREPGFGWMTGGDPKASERPANRIREALKTLESLTEPGAPFWLWRG
jgi:hypothetical protein